MQEAVSANVGAKRQEQIGQLYMQAPVSNLAIYCVALLFYFVLSPRIDSVLVPVWTACLWGTATLRLFLWLMRRKKPTLLPDRGWEYSYIVACLLVGLSWSIIYPLPYYYSADPVVAVSIYLVAFGVMGSAVIILSVSLPCFIVYTYPQAITLAVALIAQGDDVFQLVALSLVIYLAMLTMFARNFNQRMIRIAVLQDENSQLIDDLKQEVDSREQLIHARTAEIQQLSQVVEQSPVMVMITDLDGVIEYVNPRFEQVSGYSSEEVQGRNSSLLKSGLTPQNRYRELWANLSHGKTWEGEFQNRTKSGDIFWERAYIAPMHDADETVTRYLALKTDITEQKKQEQEILHQAHYDTLTDLPNRFLALDRLSQMIKNAHRNADNIAVMFLDLDDFKRINDSLGHAVGDELLVEASKRLNSEVRENDSVCRLGGDEFVILLSGFASVDALKSIARDILQVFKKPFLLRDKELVVSASLGVAMYPDDGSDTTDLLKKADTAMYHAKETGRNRYHFFTEALNEKVEHLLDVEDQLQGALGRNEFDVLYQPIVNLATMKIVSAEALIRWDSPALGKVSPEEFIPVAERGHQITEIGTYVLDKALACIARIRQDHMADFTVSVNLSPRQFRSTELLSLITGLLQKHKLDASVLKLEITEGVLMSSEDYVKETIVELMAAGVDIVMDDFGTGYSSLSYLRSYPFTALKIDKSFIADLSVDPADRELVNASLLMAHGLGLEVVAEGVETVGQLNYLKALRCDFVQGFLLSRPVSDQALFEMLNNDGGKLYPEFN